MKNIQTAIILMFLAATTQAQSNKGPELIGTIDVISRTNNYCPACRDKDKCYIVKVINLNPLLFDLKVSTDNKLVPVNKEDNIIQTLVDGLNKSTGTDIKEPAAPASSDKMGKELTKELHKSDSSLKSRINAKTDAFMQAYEEFKSSITSFKNATAQIKELTDFCSEIIGYCFDPLSVREAILANINASLRISKYLSSLPAAAPTESVLITKATTLSSSLKTEYDDCISKYGLLKTAYGQLKEETSVIATEAVDMMESSDKSIAGIKQAFEEFKPTDLTTLAAKTGSAYTLVHNPASFDREVRVYCPDIDSVITSIEIVALNKSTAVPGISPIKLDLEVKGGVRTFTGAALMINFFNVRDDKFYLDQDSIVRRAARRNAAFPSLAVMQNVFVKNCKSHVWGGTIGLSANLNNLTSITDLRIFLGPSYVFGNKSKFVISTGITGGYSEELKGFFEKDKKATPDLLTQEQNKLTDKSFRFGAYVGFAIKIF